MIKAYIYRGGIIFVAAYPDGKRMEYSAVLKYVPKSCSWSLKQRRLLFKSLPIRDTFEEAQRDLDEFARKRKLREAEGRPND